jgi:hypothetical protein
MRSLARFLLSILLSAIVPAASSADVRLFEAVLKGDRQAVQQLLHNSVDV